MTECLMDRLQPLPVSDKERAGLFVNDLVEACPELRHCFERHRETHQLIQVLLTETPYLRDLMLLQPQRLLSLLKCVPEERILEIFTKIQTVDLAGFTEPELMASLRQAKQEVALLIALCDLGGIWDVQTVTRHLSDFADHAVQTAIRFAAQKEEARGKVHFEREPATGQPIGILVLAMGKHGARELNYSSDIDLIVFYDFDKIRAEDPHNVQPALVRCVQTLVKVMQERTEHGYVFRTDLRLRPDPGSTAVAISTEAALHYYEGFGQNWERAAFIKARAIAGDRATASRFMKDISPFIWRKYMDFVTIRDVHAMKRQTHAHKGHGKIALLGHNVKLGRGGIREIEFFVQTQQLIAGGRNPVLRERSTLVGLELLCREGWILPETALDLASCYEFLRCVEHRLQMRLDEQTHSLPSDAHAFASVGRLNGFETREEFEKALLSTFKTVSQHYAKLFEKEEGLALEEGPLVFTGESEDPQTLETLTKLGFDREAQVSSLIRGWHKGRYRATRAAPARALLTQMKPKLLLAFARAPEPSRAIFAFDDFLKNLPAGVQLFSLLHANPHLFDLLVVILGSAPRLAETISRYPHVFDALLEPAFFAQMPQKEDYSRQLSATLRLATDYQDLLDRVRIFTQEQKFLIGVRFLSNSIRFDEAQTLYSNLADGVMDALLVAVADEMACQHGVIPGGVVTLLAMGTMGAREMTASSDLDLILIYKVEEEGTQSNGKRPLPASQYYARLTQRLVAALSAPTGAGIAYAVDLRLRPSGRAGPLAVEVSSFERYQKEQAWTWEHMALTRARPVGGDRALQAQTAQIIREVLATRRNVQKIAADVLAMNDRLRQAKPEMSSWDIKLTPGGLMDIEFLAQFWTLMWAQQKPELIGQNTSQTLKILRSFLEKSESGDLNELYEAHALYSALIQLFRLCFDEKPDWKRLSLDLEQRLCSFSDMPDVSRLEVRLLEIQRTVRDIFERSLKGSEEGASASL